MSNERIQRVLVAGAGTMGQDIAAFCKSGGVEVKVYDLDPQALAKGASTKLRVGHLVNHDPEWIAARTQILCELSVETRLESAVAEADLVIECLPEKLKLKREFFQRVSQLTRPDTILTTNTSMLVPSQLRDSVRDPARFAAFHFVNETWVVEIMGHDRTSPATIRKLEQFARHVKLLPIHCRKEKIGCVLNSMLSIRNFSALLLAAEGYATIEDIDRIWMMTERSPRGPFGNLDIVGLDTAHDITRLQAALTQDPQTRLVAEFLSGYIADGRLGVKSGHGFYRYPDPSYSQPDFCQPTAAPSTSSSRSNAFAAAIELAGSETAI